MPTIAPWLNINPLQYLEAIRSGAGFGLERARLRTQAHESNAQTGLGYAQLGQRASEGAANQALAFQRLREASEQNKRLGMYRDIGLGLREQSLEQRETDAERAAQLREAAQRLRASHLSFLEQARQREMGQRETTRNMTDLDKLKWESASRIISDLSGNPKYADDPEYLKSVTPQLNEARNALSEITQRYEDHPSLQPAAQPSNLKEGQRVRNKKTGQMGTVVRGQIVPDLDTDQPFQDGDPETSLLYQNMALPNTSGFFYSGDQYSP